MCRPSTGLSLPTRSSNLRLRSMAWRIRADAIRRTNTDPIGASERTMDAAWRLRAQTRFRSNQVAMGNAEGAERTSLEAFQRVRLATPPPVVAKPPDVR